MTVSGIPSAASTPTAQTDRAIMVAKKQQDVDKSQAQAVVDLIKQNVGQNLNVLA